MNPTTHPLHEAVQRYSQWSGGAAPASLSHVKAYCDSVDVSPDDEALLLALFLVADPPPAPAPKPNTPTPPRKLTIRVKVCRVLLVIVLVIWGTLVLAAIRVFFS